MAAFDLVVRATRAVVGGAQRAAEVGVANGRVAAIEPAGAGLEGATSVDLADDEVLLPGIVDSHVHVDEPGRTEWEGFEHATRAAASGGVTTIVDMPLNSIPPTVDVPALEAKRAAAQRSAIVDVAFWGGVVPANLGHLGALVEAGVRGFKAFLVDSGVPEFPAVSSAELRAALEELAPLGVPLLVHAEDAAEVAARPVPHTRRYADYLAARPGIVEARAVERVIDATRRTNGWAHIVHVSSADVLPLLEAARRDGVRVTAETCPHYLTLTAEGVPDGATEYKCAPPIREAANRDGLWAALRAGVLDQVVSDHSPSTADLKALDTGDFGAAWGGISSLQLSLPIVWTEAWERGCSLADLTAWMSEGPARLAGLPAKGAIAVGRDADLVVFAPDQTFVVDPARLRHRHAITPYAGRTLRGVVRGTFVRGRRVA